MIRILVVDDHPVVREGLVATLEDDPEFSVVGAAGSAEEALDLSAAQQPDVILLDLELPGMDGLQAIPALTAAHAQARVIILTAYDTDERVLGAIRSGAKGYLLKGAGLRRSPGRSAPCTPVGRTWSRVWRRRSWPRSARRAGEPR